MPSSANQSDVPDRAEVVARPASTARNDSADRGSAPAGAHRTDQQQAGQGQAGQGQPRERASASTRRGRATRERLQAAALALIPEVGWGAVTTRTLADRAGVNPALVHYHFRSVGDLLTDAVLESFAELLEAPVEQLTGADDVPRGIAQLLAVVQPSEGADATSQLFLEAVLAANRDERLRDGLAASVAGFRRRVGEWLSSRGHEDGPAAAAVLAGALDGLLLHRSLDASLDLKACGDVLAKFCAPESDTPTRGSRAAPHHAEGATH